MKKTKRNTTTLLFVFMIWCAIFLISQLGELYLVAINHGKIFMGLDMAVKLTFLIMWFIPLICQKVIKLRKGLFLTLFIILAAVFIIMFLPLITAYIISKLLHMNFYILYEIFSLIFILYIVNKETTVKKSKKKTSKGKKSKIKKSKSLKKGNKDFF